MPAYYEVVKVELKNGKKINAFKSNMEEKLWIEHHKYKRFSSDDINKWKTNELKPKI